MNTLNELMDYYDIEVDKFLKNNGRDFIIRIDLTDNFLNDARKRIVAGHKKYKTDWKWKNNIKEIEFEKLDILNYLLLNNCQKIHRQRKQRKKKK